VNFGKASVKAFAEDENAARSLGMTLKNLNLDYFGASQATNLYISNLEKQTGVLDDELRPAMDRFLRATSSITKSQKLLNLALDISSGTGKSLTQVSQGLQKAYLGNNASLGRLGVGLTKADLASSSFEEIQTRLTELFAGQAVSAADSYAGSLNKLTVASNNAKEAIGEGLIGALNILSGGGGSVDGGIAVIDKMSAGIAEGTKNIAFMIKQFEALKPVIIAIGALLLIYFAPITAAVAALAFILAKGGENLRKSKFNIGPAQQSPGERISIDKANAAAKKKAENDAVKLTKEKNKLSKIDNDNTLRKLALTGDEKALLELGKKFDVERIGLFAALNQTTDAETKMRLLSLIAIHDQNAALAGQITAAEKAANALEAFAAAIIAAIGALIAMTVAANTDLLKQFGTKKLAGGSGGSGGGGGFVLEDPYNFGQFQQGEKETMKQYLAGQTNITINASGIGDQQIASVVQNAIQNLNRYGNSTTFAGAI
jgi:hypothetical protein